MVFPYFINSEMSTRSSSTSSGAVVPIALAAGVAAAGVQVALSNRSSRSGSSDIGVAACAGASAAVAAAAINYCSSSESTEEKEVVTAPYFTPYEIDYTMHAENRAKLVERFRKLSNIPEKSVILLKGGEETNNYCTDTNPVFRQESFFQYCFGVREPGFFGLIDLASGESCLFPPKQGLDYAIWCGELLSEEQWREHYLVDTVEFSDQMGAALEKRGVKHAYVLKGLNTDSGLTTVTTFTPEDLKVNGGEKLVKSGAIEFHDCNTLHRELVECRVTKSAKELKLMAYTNRLSSAAHRAVMRCVTAGMFEFQLESTFKHECFFRGGARHVAYTCICGAGPSGASLHYGHAGAPNDQVLKEGEAVLLDMGGEFHCYASDITCSYPVNGKFSPDQATLYNAVLKGHDLACAGVRAGVDYTSLHELSLVEVARGLVEVGVLRGATPEKLVELDVAGLFMPHGLGHLMGLDVHDVGGWPVHVTKARSTRPSFKGLRIGRPLEDGMVLTIEPGVYFIDELLNRALAPGSEIAQYIDADQLARFRGTGGVRIESNVVVRSWGHEMLTRVPRTVEEIEKFMETGEWSHQGGAVAASTK